LRRKSAELERGAECPAQGRDQGRLAAADRAADAQAQRAAVAVGGVVVIVMVGAHERGPS
jgi:hypothetical protein